MRLVDRYVNSNGESHGRLSQIDRDHEDDESVGQTSTTECDHEGDEYGDDKGAFFAFLLI